MSIKRQTVWSMLPLLVTAAVGFFTMPLFLRYLGNDMYALWGYIVTFGGLFGFADLGLGVAVGRYISIALGKNDLAAVRSYWGTGNLLILPFLVLTGLIFIIVGVWYGPHWFNKIPATHVRLLQGCFVAGGGGLFLSYYAQFWLVLSQAHLDFKFISVVRVIITLVQILPMIGIAYYTHNPLLLVLWGALTSLLQLGIFIWHARRSYKIGFHFQAASFERAREMAAFTGKIFLNLIINAYLGSVDRVILGKLAPTAAFSPYFFSGNIAARLQGLSASFMGPIFYNASRAVNEGRESAAKIYNDTFAFVFEWYLFAILWVGLWHSVLLRLWLTRSMGEELGAETALQVGALLVPLLAAAGFSSIANISNSQLASMDRLGATMGFSIMTGLLAVVGVWVGWQAAGVIGAAYGFLFSRLALVAQDLFAIRLLQARGWLDRRTWFQMGGQGLLAAGFATLYLVWPRDSYWLLPFAALHGGLVATWLLRHKIGKVIAKLPPFYRLGHLFR